MTKIERMGLDAKYDVDVFLEIQQVLGKHKITDCCMTIDTHSEHFIAYQKHRDILKTVEEELEKQCAQTKAFGDELQFYKKKKENVLFELKIKKYRDEIVELKRKLATTPNICLEGL